MHVRYVCRPFDKVVVPAFLADDRRQEVVSSRRSAPKILDIYLDRDENFSGPNEQSAHYVGIEPFAIRNRALRQS